MRHLLLVNALLPLPLLRPYSFKSIIGSLERSHQEATRENLPDNDAGSGCGTTW